MRINNSIIKILLPTLLYSSVNIGLLKAQVVNKNKPKTEINSEINRLEELIKTSKNIEKIKKSHQMLITYTIYENEGKKYPYKNSCMSIVYKDFILTTTHGVVDERKVGILIDNQYYDYQKIQNKNEHTFLRDVPLDVIIKKTENDVAVFRLPPNYDGAKFPFELGDSDNIYDGQEIYVIGNPGLTGLKLRPGTISSTTKKNYFTISTLIVNGDSGTAVVDKKTFKLLGLVHGNGYNTHIGIVAPINNYKPHLK